MLQVIVERCLPDVRDVLLSFPAGVCHQRLKTRPGERTGCGHACGLALVDVQPVLIIAESEQGLSVLSGLHDLPVLPFCGLSFNSPVLYGSKF